MRQFAKDLFIASVICGTVWLVGMFIMLRHVQEVV